MDRSVRPDSTIARLPDSLRTPALVLRHMIHVVRTRRKGYVYQSDGFATAHYSPFLGDPEFASLYAAVHDRWTGEPIDIRWRVWILLQCARQTAALGCSLAEFGVYRGACAFLMLSNAQLQQQQHFFLFDTFAGIPGYRLTAKEERDRFGGRLVDTSAEEVATLLAGWSSQISLVSGDVFDTLPNTETGPLGFAHIDLNASAPTKAVLQYVYPRLVASGMIVFDDYGQEGYKDQRAVIDEFFATKPESVIALPTGQGLAMRTATARVGA